MPYLGSLELDRVQIVALVHEAEHHGVDLLGSHSELHPLYVAEVGKDGIEPVEVRLHGAVCGAVRFGALCRV